MNKKKQESLMMTSATAFHKNINKKKKVVANVGKTIDKLISAGYNILDYRIILETSIIRPDWT